MKIIITEEQFKVLIEQVTNVDEYYSLMDETLRNVFRSIRNRKKIEFIKINPQQFKRAADEFMEFKGFYKFPVKYIFEWKEYILYDVALLRALTEIHGHTQFFPFDEFYDEFDISPDDHRYDFYEAYEVLEKYNIDDYVPFFSNGQPVLSDYGLDPIEKLTRELITEENPVHILITINKILDIMHQRSDLSELFIEGGGGSLDFISNS